jgi:hypothetical protein
MSLQQRLARKFDLSDFNAPTELIFDDITARRLTRKDLEADLAAVNSSLDLIIKTRGGSWPSEKVTEEFDLLDLAWHEREFRENSSFAYVIYDKTGNYLGCFYLYPIGVRTPLNEETEQYDLDVSWWVKTKAYEEGYYDKLFKALKIWLKEFPFQTPYFSNKEIPA